MRVCAEHARVVVYRTNDVRSPSRACNLDESTASAWDGSSLPANSECGDTTRLCAYAKALHLAGFGGVIRRSKYTEVVPRLPLSLALVPEGLPRRM